MKTLKAPECCFVSPALSRADDFQLLQAHKWAVFVETGQAISLSMGNSSRTLSALIVWCILPANEYGRANGLAVCGLRGTKGRKNAACQVYLVSYVL